MITPEVKDKVLKFQKSELTDYIVYNKLSTIVKDKQHSQILKRIAHDEDTHYNIFKKITQKDVTPYHFKAFFYVFVSRFLGLNFGLRLMENAEVLTQDNYKQIKDISSELERVITDEAEHEKEMIGMIDEERLKYVSSMVLGLNDALVELSGALVGFTLALQNIRLVGIVGLITGIAASMSMAASEYLSTKQEETDKSPLKASVYTGLAYIGTVVILVLPYFLFTNIFFCLGLVIFNMLLLILIFTFYISVAKELDFKKRFLEMAGISLGVAVINFSVGLIIRKIFGIEI